MSSNPVFMKHCQWGEHTVIEGQGNDVKYIHDCIRWAWLTACRGRQSEVWWHRTGSLGTDTRSKVHTVEKDKIQNKVFMFVANSDSSSTLPYSFPQPTKHTMFAQCQWWSRGCWPAADWTTSTSCSWGFHPQRWTRRFPYGPQRRIRWPRRWWTGAGAGLWTGGEWGTCYTQTLQHDLQYESIHIWEIVFSTPLSIWGKMNPPFESLEEITDHQTEAQLVIRLLYGTQ